MIPQEYQKFYLKDVTFVNLMMRRIYNVLIVANPYDAFMLEDDGRVEEKIYNEYVELGLRYPDADDAHGGEGEEGERLVARPGEHIAHDEVGRGADEGEHAAHAACKGQRHEETRRRESGPAGHAHHDGEHQGHSARVAHKGSHHRGGEHEEHEEAGVVGAGQAEDAGPDALGQPGAEDATAHNEEAHHHHHDGTGKPGQGLLGGEDAAKHKGQRRTHGYEVGTDASAHKEQGRKGQDQEGGCHVGNGASG